MYKIATLNKISSKGLSQFTDSYTMVEEVKDANGIIVRSANMHDLCFDNKLLAVARAGAGYNNIPIERYAHEGVVVFNTPGANANAVKELVIAGMLLSARNLPEAMTWERSLCENIKTTVEKGKGKFSGQEIQGKTLGVIGLGAIGVTVANVAQSLNMCVLGYDPFITLKAAHNLSNTIPVIKDLSELLSMCDYVTIHVPVVEDTMGMIDSRRLGQMKEGAVLMNFSRDTLVSDEALLYALSTGKIRHYVTDFPNEKLQCQKGVIAIPHLGASTSEAEDNCATMAADQLMEYIENGNIINSVNFPACSLGKLNSQAAARVCILNRNIPAMLGKITGIMADLNINIRDLTNKSKGDFACTIMDIDGDISDQDMMAALDIDGVLRMRILR